MNSASKEQAVRRSVIVVVILILSAGVFLVGFNLAREATSPNGSAPVKLIPSKPVPMVHSHPAHVVTAPMTTTTVQSVPAATVPAPPVVTNVGPANIPTPTPTTVPPLPPTGTTPNIIGMSSSEAPQAITAAGFIPQAGSPDLGGATVVWQDPSAGSTAQLGSPVIYILRSTTLQPSDAP
jgi:hypothetical protein